MAKTVQNPQVGQFVYRHYKPLNPGVIREIVKPHRTVGVIVKVQWLKGGESEEWEAHLADYLALIEDHRRKYLNHSEIASKLHKLKEN
jgi:hypothetical protein